VTRSSATAEIARAKSKIPATLYGLRHIHWS